MCYCVLINMKTNEKNIDKKIWGNNNWENKKITNKQKTNKFDINKFDTGKLTQSSKLHHTNSIHTSIKPEPVIAKKVIALKGLGQNFLSDMRFIAKIINAAGIDNNVNANNGKDCVLKDNLEKEMTKSKYDCIVEIGPGMGVLTKRLLNFGLPVYVVEKDPRCVAYLKQMFLQENDLETDTDNVNIFRGGGNNLHIIHADALEFDFSSLPGKNRILVANLPYNVSVPIILNYLADTSLFKKYCVLIQKEVAERLVGKVNTRDYGRLAVLAQTFCNVKKNFDIPGNAFRPTTKVTSTFVTLTPKIDISAEKIAFKAFSDFKALSSLVEKCFAYRRKMLRKSLALYPDLIAKLKQLGIEDTKRAEQLDRQVFLDLLSS